MNPRKRHFGRLGRLAGLALGCVALLMPPTLASSLPVSSSGQRPFEEEESRAPVEMVKIALGAIHQEQDRREQPEPLFAVKPSPGSQGQPNFRRTFVSFQAQHAYDSHNGLGGPLIV